MTPVEWIKSEITRLYYDQTEFNPLDIYMLIDKALKMEKDDRNKSSK